MDEPIVFSQEQTEFLEKAAKRYIWWMTKEEAMMDPFFVISGRSQRFRETFLRV